ncbi:hypothetical protein JCM8097_001717 [Rhodosporidiobolus ruineniae]
MSSSSDTLTALEGMLSALPAGSNPYLALSSYVASTLKHDLPNHYFIQMYFLGGSFAVIVLLVILALALQARTGRFRLVKVEHGALAATEGHSLVLAFGAAAFVVAIATVFESVKYQRGEVVMSYVGLRAMMWWPLYVAAFLALHTMAHNYLSHLRLSSSLSSARAQSLSKHLTALLFLTLVLYFASTAAPDALSVMHFHKAMDAFKTIMGMLGQGAAAWTEESAFSMDSLATALPLLATVTSEQAKLIKTMSVAFAMLSAWAVTFTASIALVALLHIRALTASIAAAAAAVPGKEDNNAVVARLSKTRAVLKRNTGAFVVAICIFIAVALYASIKTGDAVNKLVPIMAVDLTLYWFYFLAGLSIALYVLHAELLALQAYRAGACEKEEDGESSLVGTDGEEKEKEAAAGEVV